MFRPAVTALASLMAMSGAAYADFISLPAMGFVRYDPAGTTQDPTPDNGSLSPVISATLFAGVEFPINGNNICRLILVYGDTNGAEGISAKLMRKLIPNGGAVNATPTTLATVSSTGTVVGMRKVATSVVSNRLINEANSFYYVEVLAQNFNTPLVGVQIEHKPTCP